MPTPTPEQTQAAESMVLTGDCLTVVASMPSDSFDSIVTDPPYGLSFMGKAWDHQVPDSSYWKEFLRVAKPGAHLVAFGGTRTWHRLACAIEDAGWELRDTLSWMYGQGFPKSLDVSKAIDKAAGAERTEVIGKRHRNVKPFDDDNGWNANGTTGDHAYTAPATDAARQWSGWGTALKPAWEPIIVARKPLCGTVAENVLRYGTGGINVDGCRVGTEAVTINTWNDGAKPFGGGAGHEYTGRTVQGRWPANVVLDAEAAQALDEQTGTLTSGKVTKTYTRITRNSVALGTKERNLSPNNVYSDSGGASRFFYVAKASTAERTHGGNVQNTHPTVKPVALMRWLSKLITPPGGKVLEPFAGSGTTIVACLEEGFECLGVEQSTENAAIAKARVALTLAQQSAPRSKGKI